YRILRPLGRGGMGQVLLAQDLAANGREVALKRIARSGSAERAQFEHEFLLLSRLRHPNVAEVYDFGAVEGSDDECFYTFEFVKGIDLFEATTKASWDDMLVWAAQVCRGLDYVHSRGIVHFDVKPANVLVRTADD